MAAIRMEKLDHLLEGQVRVSVANTLGRISCFADI